MKAWEFNGAGNPLVLKEVPDPVAGPGEIVIDVQAVGLCHSDVSALDDPNWAVNFSRLPVVLGHEPAGVVSQVGEGVTNLKVGDRVGVPSGPPNNLGYSRNGAYAEKTCAIADAVVKIPDGVDFTVAAACTDAGNVAYHAVVNRGHVQKGEKVAIIGVGGLGQFGVRIASLQGAEVYVAEPKESQWRMAKELGAVKCAKDIRDFAGMGLDAAIDFAGFGTTSTGAIDVVKEHGRVVQVGMGRLEFPFNSNNLIIHQVDYIGSMGGGIDDLSGVYSLLGPGRLEPRVEVIHFDQIDEGLDRLRHGQANNGRLVADLRLDK